MVFFPPKGGVELGGEERDIYLLFHLLMYSLVASCMCPDLGLNSNLGVFGLYVTNRELPGQGMDVYLLRFSSF